MRIEKAEINNAEEILILQKLAYQSEAKLVNDFNIPPLIQTLDQIKKQFTDHVFLKVVENNIIIGSVRAFEKNETIYIGRLIVHPDKENKGIGSKLMKEIENYFKKANRFELFTGSESKKNIYLYSKLGYKIFKTEKFNDKVIFVYMEKIKFLTMLKEEVIMEIKNLEQKKIRGFAIRTTNKKEMNPLTGQIPGLWRKFDENVVVDYRNGNYVYGVYFDYESDASGEFTVLAGTDQSNINSSEALETIVIQSGKYLTFHAIGEMPQIVIDTWVKIWKYFLQEGIEYKRTYTIDFEYYVNQNEIKIYIAVE